DTGSISCSIWPVGFAATVSWWGNCSKLRTPRWAARWSRRSQRRRRWQGRLSAASW
ncbi:hypothetical protein ACJX0J_041542, partial [Zea mays]